MNLHCQNRRLGEWFWGVKAIRFHLKSGSFSEICGRPDNPSEPSTSFEGKHPGSKLVGVHGLSNYDHQSNIQKLSFTFATDMLDNTCFPPASVETSSEGM
jgi:hypothetical protein